MKKTAKLFVTMFIVFTLIISASAITLDTAENPKEANATAELASDIDLIGVFDTWIDGRATDGVYASTFAYANETVEWSIDVGNTKATFEFDEASNGVYITAAGYPGEVTITAKSGDLIETEVITIVGRDADKWLPGVDLISGTENGWTFDFSDDVNNIVGYVAGGTSYSNNVTVPCGGGMVSYYAVPNYPAFGDRPVEVSAYVGGNPGGYTLSIESVDCTSTWAGTSGEGQKSYKFVGNTSENRMLFTFVGWWGSLTLDNLSLVPYYKVTYYGFDGSEVSSEYVLPADGKLIPDLSKVEGATGFALEADGETVSEVILTDKDIELYAVNRTSMNFVAGNDSKEVILEEGSFTFPAAASLGLTATNFRVWTDGTSFYEAGEAIEDAMSLEGKTFTAVCFEEKLFDINKGDLVFFFDYEGDSWSTPTYLNKAYTTSIGTTLQQIDRTWMRLVDGHLEVTGSIGQYQVFGYAIDHNAKTVGSTAATTIDLANHTAYTGLAVNALIFNKGESFAWNNGYFHGGFLNMAASADEWYSKTIYMADEEGTGFNGNVVQLTNYAGLNNSVLYVDNWAFYVYPAKTFVLLDAQGSETYTKVEAEGDTYIMPAHGNAIAWTDGADTYNVGESYDVADLQFKALYPVYIDAEKYKAPEMMGVTEIRGTGANNGIRFKASIMPSVKENLDEIGFIATREVLLPHEGDVYDYNALTFDYMNGDKALYASAVSYDADGNKDIINCTEDNGGIIYSAVLTGISLDNKKENMVVRSYAKFSINGNTYTVYGNTDCDSLYDAASRIKEAGGEAYEINKAYISTIVD